MFSSNGAAVENAIRRPADDHRDPDESAGRRKPTFLPNHRILARVLPTFDAAA